MHKHAWLWMEWLVQTLCVASFSIVKKISFTLCIYADQYSVECFDSYMMETKQPVKKKQKNPTTQSSLPVVTTSGSVRCFIDAHLWSYDHSFWLLPLQWIPWTQSTCFSVPHMFQDSNTLAHTHTHTFKYTNTGLNINMYKVLYVFKKSLVQYKQCSTKLYLLFVLLPDDLFYVYSFFFTFSEKLYHYHYFTKIEACFFLMKTGSHVLNNFSEDYIWQNKNNLHHNPNLGWVWHVIIFDIV